MSPTRTPAADEVVRHARDFCAGRLDGSGLAAALDGSPEPDAAFWTGAGLAEAGDPAAAAHLRRWLESPRSEPGGSCATVLLVYAESGLLEAVRHLLREHGDRWWEASPFAADRVVADVADREPALLVPVLSGDLPVGRLSHDVRLRAARALLRLALGAEHAGLTASRLELAERLLGER